MSTIRTVGSALKRAALSVSPYHMSIATKLHPKLGKGQEPVPSDVSTRQSISRLQSLGIVTVALGSYMIFARAVEFKLDLPYGALTMGACKLLAAGACLNATVQSARDIYAYFAEKRRATSPWSISIRDRLLSNVIINGACLAQVVFLAHVGRIGITLAVHSTYSMMHHLAGVIN